MRPRKLQLASSVLEESFVGNQRNKKRAERSVITEFFKRIGLRPKRITSGECPDFGVVLDRKTVGLEAVSYHFDAARKGSDLYTLFNNWRQLATALREDMRGEGPSLKGWYGAIHFRPPFTESLQSLDKSRFRNELVALAKKELPGKRTAKGWIAIKDFNAFPCLNESVALINCLKQSGQSFPLWWHASLQSGFVPEPAPMLATIIKEKEVKAQRYQRDNIDELWLLIYARAADLSESIFALSDHTLAPLKNQTGSNFSRILIWDKFYESVWEVWPSLRSIPPS